MIRFSRIAAAATLLAAFAMPVMAQGTAKSSTTTTHAKAPIHRVAAGPETAKPGTDAAKKIEAGKTASTAKPAVTAASPAAKPATSGTPAPVKSN